MTLQRSAILKGCWCTAHTIAHSGDFPPLSAGGQAGGRAVVGAGEGGLIRATRFFL